MIYEEDCQKRLRFLNQLKECKKLCPDEKVVLWDIWESFSSREDMFFCYDEGVRTQIMSRNNLKKGTVDRCISNLVYEGLLIASPQMECDIKAEHAVRIGLSTEVSKGDLH